MKLRITDVSWEADWGTDIAYFMYEKDNEGRNGIFVAMSKERAIDGSADGWFSYSDVERAQ